MTIWGKVIGFFLGWFVMGPLGSLIGLMIGALFDKGLYKNLHSIPRSHTESVQKAFFTATFSVMGHLAKADGRVSVDEIRAAEDIMTKLELDDVLRKEAIHLFNQGKSSHYDLEKHLALLWQECHKHHDLLRFFIEIQLQAALSDGDLNKAEEKILLLICKRLRVSPHEFEDLIQRQWASQAFYQWYENFEQGHFRGQQRDYSSYGSYGTHDSYTDNTDYNYQRQQYQNQRRRAYQQAPQSSLQDAYGVLGISKEASEAEIKKAYRRLMNQHHPDKLVSRGLPEEMLKLAQEKTQQIRAAYDLIREARGFR